MYLAHCRGMAGQSGLDHGLFQPDSLRLCASLELLKHLHLVAASVEERYGDKAPDRTFFISGVQGRVSKPTLSKDYSYFCARIADIRAFLSERCVRTTLDELARTAVNIYSRFDNRRRMGVEILVLAMLVNENSTTFEIPEKYHSPVFVLEMLVSCRQRFQKPEKSYFWSRQSESLLTSTFLHCRHLARVKLPGANDVLLKALAVHCRALQELEVQLALDVTDEGLMALAGVAVQKTDLGMPAVWPNALTQSKDFGPYKDWFVKDCFCFTPVSQTLPSGMHPVPAAYETLLHDVNAPPVTTSSSYGPLAVVSLAAPMPKLYSTGFGCRKLVKLRINGDFIFPPLVRLNSVPGSHNHMEEKLRRFKGPVIEVGLYALLSSLPALQKVNMSRLPHILACMAASYERGQMILPRIRLKTISFERGPFTTDDFEYLDEVCGEVEELYNLAPGRAFGDHTGIIDCCYAPQACQFLCRSKRLERVSQFMGKMTLLCFNSALAVRGKTLTKVHLTTEIRQLEDLLTLRSCAPNIEVLEGNFVLMTPHSSPGSPEGSMSIDSTSFIFSGYLRHMERHREDLLPAVGATKLSSLSSNFSPDLLSILKNSPLPRLRVLDIEGKLNLLAFQLLTGAADALEELHITNSPIDLEAKAWSDEWLDALLHVNSLKRLKNLTLRMIKAQVVETGSFSERGLTRLLDHCVKHNPRLQRLCGEFTRIPDTSLQDKVAYYGNRGMRFLQVKNAVPYRRFENIHDSERYYGMNEGYRKMLQEQMVQQQQLIGQMEVMQVHHPAHHQPQQQQQAIPGAPGVVQAPAVAPQAPAAGSVDDAAQQRRRGSKRFNGYVFRPFESRADFGHPGMN